MRNGPEVVAGFVIAGSLVVSACGANPEGADASAEPGFPMTINSCGREVTIEQPPRRVVTIGEDAATLAWAGGVGGKLVARAQDPDAPVGAATPALTQVPNFAPQGSPSRESIIAQEPDLVISWGLFETTPEALDQAGIDSYELSGYCDEPNNPDKDQDYEDVYHHIELFGRMFGTQDRAASQIEELRQRVQAVRDRIGSEPERTVGVLYVSGTTLLAYNKSTMAHTQLDILGLTNVFADVTGDAHAEISLEEVIARDPDQVVLLSYEQTDEQAKQALLDQSTGADLPHPASSDHQRPARASTPARPPRLSVVRHPRRTTGRSWNDHHPSQTPHLQLSCQTPMSRHPSEVSCGTGMRSRGAGAERARIPCPGRAARRDCRSRRPPVAEDDEAIGAADGRQPVRTHDQGAVP